MEITIKSITKEWIDTHCPNHCRTSCSDDNLNNSYGGWNGLYNRNTGERDINYPRCNRCYLLDNIGMNPNDLEFKITTEIYLEWKGFGNG